MWAYARQGWKNGDWHPLVSPTNPAETGGAYQYNGDAPIDPASGANTLAEFHRKLRDISATDIPIGFVFKPLAHFFHLEGDRKQRAARGVRGQRRQAAGRGRPAPGCSRPRPDARRRDVARASGGAPGRRASPRSMRMEADALSKSGADGAPAGILQAGRHLRDRRRARHGGQELRLTSDDFLWTYTKNPAASWPPSWLPAGAARSTPTSRSGPGWSGCSPTRPRACKARNRASASIKGLRDDLREFRVREGKLNDLATTDDRTRSRRPDARPRCRS